MSMTKEQAMALITADGVCGADADQQADCLQVAANGLASLGISVWDIVAKLPQIVDIVKRAGNTVMDWIAKLKDIFALFGKTPNVTMPS